MSGISSAEATQDKQAARPKLLEVLGPGLITGASDDDPSGIATYSQVGAQFGYGLGWTLLLTFPLMCAIQQISAQIGCVTGRGLAGNMRRQSSAWVLHAIVGLLVVANTINIGADLGAMGAALTLLVGGPTLLYVALIALITVVLAVFVQYSHYVSVLKWLTLSLFAYVATVFVVDVPWGQVGANLVYPHISWDSAYLTAVVAVFGTTISPYLFFWQAGQEVEEQKEDPATSPLREAPEQAPSQLTRIRLDTYVGMALSNLIALCIVITAAATLHANGQTDIQTSSQAAEALRPIAGKFAFTVFAAGIIGTGLLALPVLAGSAAYALGEAFQWPVGLARRPYAAHAFYATIAIATLIGVLINFSPIDPVKALFWSAVINGVVAVPVMVMTMLLASRRAVMAQFALGTPLKTMGWVATGVMTAAAVGMFATL
ncbi:NRAMP family divalent metal transporter [Limobrevibacterium gyesilva]|uniref:Divalent metal cation transporter n=1 Tax=Limobrevibacterium gyesilva TaxID=2991712 RepID=A0AA42CJR1_9PROT|nr:divalent metal cation transporter [Limobrevibacterium gyesilva]MCW3477152.1 divalent metal cation transporter [Limobrevibacterium gyesilva]